MIDLGNKAPPKSILDLEPQTKKMKLKLRIKSKSPPRNEKLLDVPRAERKMKEL